MNGSEANESWLQRQRNLEAGEWLLRLQDPNLEPHTVESWWHWRAAPENEAAFEAVELAWRKIAAVTLAPVVPTVAVAAPRRTRIPLWTGLAAGVAALAVAVFLSLTFTSGQTIENKARRWKQVDMQDGSVIFVGPDSHLIGDVTSELRSVAAERGAAIFEVAKDERPFVVTTVAGDARAVGTKFGVAIGKDAAVFAVAEGRIEVLPKLPGDAGARQRFLAAGEQLTIGDGKVESRAVDAMQELLWTQGWCVFNDETLAEVVSMLNRYSHLQIQIEDAQLAGTRLSKRFRLKCNDPEEIIRLLAETHGAVLVREGSTLKLQAAPR